MNMIRIILVQILQQIIFNIFSFSIEKLLGPQTYLKNNTNLNEDTYIENLKLKEGTNIYVCHINLEFYDYHRWRSPVDWSLNYIRHYTGKYTIIPEWGLY